MPQKHIQHHAFSHQRPLLFPCSTSKTVLSRFRQRFPGTRAFKRNTVMRTAVVYVLGRAFLRAVLEPIVVLTDCIQFSCSFVLFFFCVGNVARNMLPLYLFPAIFDRTPYNFCNNAVSWYFCVICGCIGNGPRSRIQPQEFLP